MPPGNYSVHVDDAAQTSTAPGNLSVVVGIGGNLSIVTLSPPTTVFVGAIDTRDNQRLATTATRP